jgi:hypothetical protein
MALALTNPALALVFDTTISDVTTRAFSVVWASDEPVTSATVWVYDDANGSSDITGGLTTTLQSDGLTNGLVKVDVRAIPPGTCVYIQTETTASGVILEPAAPPFTEVCTTVETTKANALGEVITNDIVRHDILLPGGGAAMGALALMSVPSVGGHAVSSFAGQGYALPTATADLNNLFEAGSGRSAQTAADDVIRIVEMRGLACPNLQDHVLVRYRRVPPHDEVVAVGTPLIELETPGQCFFADALCDDRIDILDVQRVLNVFGSSSGECAFNDDLDLVADGTINILDAQGVLNRFGQTAPFPP